MQAMDFINKILGFIEVGEYKKVLSEINNSAKTICHGLTKDKISEIYYYWGRCLYESGEYKKSLYKLKVALTLLVKSNDHLLYARVKYYLGRVLLRLGRTYDSLEIFTESFLYYKRIKKYDEIFIPLDNMAHVHLLLGDINKAIEVLKQELIYLIKTDSKKNIDITNRNLARVLMYGGNFEEATEILSTFNIKNVTGLPKAHIFTLKGMLNTFRLEHTRAVSFLNKAKAIFSEHGIARDIAVCNEYLGLNEFFRQRYRKAKEYYRMVLDMPEPTASAVGQTLRMLTDVYIAEGNLIRAEETAQKAEQAITRINERIELGAIWRAYGRIYTLKGENDKAREYFSKSSELLRTIGARYELAQTCMACGRSKAFEKDEQISFLSTALGLFNEMKVIPRSIEIEKLIENRRIGSSLWQIPHGDGKSAPVIIAGNARMREIISLAEQMAPHNISVLLTGATGTGKDLLARYIHHVSGRKGQFVMVNSAAIPNDMVEAELFGYSKGAFTGADHERMGLIEMAAEGTLYLNEIVDASLVFQAKLLEVLENHKVRRLGENEIREIDFRLICASNHDLEKHLKKNKFRKDFYHRIKETEIHLPPLDDRSDDIPDLALHFMQTLDGFSEKSGNKNTVREICRLLGKQRWPGNVRELRSEIKRVWVVAHGDLEEFLQLVRNHVEQDSRDLLIDVLHETDWNKREAARVLGVSDGTIRNWIRKYVF